MYFASGIKYFVILMLTVVISSDEDELERHVLMAPKGNK